MPVFLSKKHFAIAWTITLTLFSPFLSASAGVLPGVLEDAIQMDPITDHDLQNVIWGRRPERALGPSRAPAVEPKPDSAVEPQPKSAPSRRRPTTHAKRRRRPGHRAHHHTAIHPADRAKNHAGVHPANRASNHTPVHPLHQRRRSQFRSTEFHLNDCEQDNRFARIDPLIADAAKIQQAVGCAPAEYVQLEKARQAYFQIVTGAVTGSSAGESSPSSQTRTIQGRVLQGTADELNAAEAILRTNPPQSWILSSTPNCTSVRCALTEAFNSEEAALRAIMIHKKYGYAISLSQKYAFRYSEKIHENLWTATQVRGIEEFLSRLPSSVLKRARLKEIALFSPEMAEAVARDTHLQVYPSGVYNAHDPENPHILINTLGHATTEGIHHVFAHEFGHAFDFASYPRFSQASGFESISQWQNLRQSNGTYSRNNHTKFIEKYSETSPLEDFADSFNYFINHPEVLKEVEPKKYAFLKSQVFEGKEFTPVGVIPSLELEDRIDLKGGYSALLRECVSNLEMRLGSQGELWVAEGGPEGANLRADVFVEQGANTCFQTAAQALAKDLSQNTEVCRMGGAEGIEAHLKAQLNYPLQKVLRGVAEKMAKISKMDGQSDLACEDFDELEQLVALKVGAKFGQHCR